MLLATNIRYFFISIWFNLNANHLGRNLKLSVQKPLVVCNSVAEVAVLMVIVTWWNSYRLHAFRLHSSLHSSWLWRQESSSGEFTSNICCLSDIVIITQSTWKANFHVYSGESHPNIRLCVAKRLRLTSALTSLVTERIDWFYYFYSFLLFIYSFS